ncbi:uncharacterized protein LOC135392065 [Ornithodoros turicata]|uniref:uncharacterized protein LOC135392065 n=1 Tax=Ornithodoros turicata TaxID=34597 RepID=UPI003138D43B
MTTLIEIESHLDCKPHAHVVLLGDFNAKNPAWGGTTADPRGDELIEFMLLNDLRPLNNPHSPPHTFDRPRGTSWIDITIVREIHAHNSLNWQVLNTQSCSDHKYISFEIFNPPSPYIFKTTKKSRQETMDRLATDGWFKMITNKYTKESLNPDAAVYALRKKITTYNTTYKQQAIRRITPHHTVNPWGTPQLDDIRREARRLRRQVQWEWRTQPNPPILIPYKRMAATYKKALIQAKACAWENLCAKLTPKNPYGEAYKKSERTHT